MLHTYSEGFSNVISEAMLSGLPVITTDIEANREIIDNGKNGILIELDNIDKWTKEITRLLKNIKKRKILGMNAREKILSNFSVYKMMKSYEKLYLEILK